MAQDAQEIDIGLEEYLLERFFRRENLPAIVDQFALLVALAERIGIARLTNFLDEFERCVLKFSKPIHEEFVCELLEFLVGREIEMERYVAPTNFDGDWLACRVHDYSGPSTI
jgi:hypothetical protein